jgi:S1-C subfamily serine protease
MTEARADEPRSAKKLLGSPAVKLRLALASGLVLGAGALLAPRAAPTALSATQERAAPLLEEQGYRAGTAEPFRGVSDVAARVREYGVAIPAAPEPVAPTFNDFAEPPGRPRPAGFGVFVSDVYVLTHSAALDGRSSVPLATADGRMLDARVAAYELSTGLALLQTEPSTRPSLPLAPDAPAAGTLAVAVGRWDGRDIAVPLFVTTVGTDHYRLGAADQAVRAGMPLYTLDGELFAIAAGAGRDSIAFPVREAARRLMARAAAGDERVSFGLGIQGVSESLAAVFGSAGVVVNQVVPGGPADAAGIAPGDLLLAVGDVPTGSTEAAARALILVTPGAPAALRLSRAGRVRTVEATPVPAYQVAALARTAGAPGPEAGVLFPQAILDAARVPAAARVLTVNGRAVTSRPQAMRELRGRQPVPVLLDLDGRRFFAAIGPPR